MSLVEHDRLSPLIDNSDELDWRQHLRVQGVLAQTDSTALDEVRDLLKSLPALTTVIDPKSRDHTFWIGFPSQGGQVNLDLLIAGLTARAEHLIDDGFEQTAIELFSLLHPSYKKDFLLEAK